MKLILIIPIILFINIVAAQTVDCDCQGYLIDPDITGTNIRFKPAGDIIATIKNQDPKSKIDIYTFDILGSNGTWLKINMDYIKLEGYIFNKLVGTTLKHGKVKIYKNTNEDIFEVINIKEFDFVIMILDCKSNWIRSEFIYNNRKYSGWIKNFHTCPNPYTTCG